MPEGHALTPSSSASGQASLFDDDPAAATDGRSTASTDEHHERIQRHEPGDHPARRRIERDIGSTLFVEAGAGAGKTTSLVARVVELVEDGVDIRAIAPITFTEKAAAELRHRLRNGLADADTERSRAALAHLDHAAIGTLHSFARRILDDHALAAGLPPGFSVLDELESNLRFDEEWEEHLDGLLADPDPTGGVVEGGATFAQVANVDGFRIDHDLRQVADDFRHDWDLVERHVDRSDPGPLHLPFDEIVDEALAIGGEPTPPHDAQSERVAEIAEWGRTVRDAPTLALQIDGLGRLEDRSRKVKRTGSQAKWSDHGGKEALAALREREIALADRIDEARNEFRAFRRRLVGAVCGRFVVDAVRRRVDAGALEFHDLLVHTRHLLASDPSVRGALHDRYTHLLLDEFQDTDPIQLEIAVRIAASPDDPRHDGDWRTLRPLPGRLFVVGDPKQSIYRFRRADIAQYLRAAEQIGAERVDLTANFRSTEPVIRFVNDVFGRVIEGVDGSQPPYRALDVERQHHPDIGTVTVLGADHHDDGDERVSADELRRREADDVVGAVQAALREGWEVSEERGDEPPQTRRCRPGDICILLPARTSLPFLDDALKRAGIPYRAENSSVVYGAPEVRDLLLAVRAADDPTDELAVVSALRTPMYGCSDVDLYDWARSGGRWSIVGRHPDGTEAHPVRRALDHLRSVHDRVPVLGAADLLVAVIDERRVLDLALARHDARDVWRRLRFVVEQARSWADAGGRGIRRYLAWARLQAAEGRIAESVLPETDHDAVRIMTVHAAKGLEFPITVVTGTTTQRQVRRGIKVVWNGPEWMFTGRGDDGTFADFAPIDEQMSDAERRRLLYVACTRAVDHLVVSVHRTRSETELLELHDEGKLTAAELLVRHGALGEASGSIARSFDVDPRDAATTTIEIGDDELDRLASDAERWATERERALDVAARPSAIAATRLADEVTMMRERADDVDPGLEKQAVNIDLPPWQRGRYGTAIGRAVHGTLQFCDLDDGHDIDPLARSQCAAEGIIGSHPTVAALARSALAAPIVRRAAGGAEHHRELFIAAPVGDRLLEGYIDLLVRDHDGLVIVDYKTDRWSGPVQTAERIERYRTQLAAYGAALETVLGEPVVRGVLVHCVAGEPADEIDVADWRGAVAEVGRLVGSGSTV